MIDRGNETSSGTLRALEARVAAPRRANRRSADEQSGDEQSAGERAGSDLGARAFAEHGGGRTKAAASGAAHWLSRLTAHVERQRRRHPSAELAVLIDVDGSLLDLRPGLLARLEGWAERHGSEHFDGLRPQDVVPDEAGLRRLFDARGLDYAAREELLVDCERFCWSPDAVLGAHQPCLGMLEVLRWMQMQPGVFVVLNSSRSEARREETVQALRTLCHHYGMGLAADRVRLAPASNDGGSDAHGQADPIASKLAGIEHFRALGYVPIAVVDDDADAIERIAECVGDRDVLCLVGAAFERTGATFDEVCGVEPGAASERAPDRAAAAASAFAPAVSVVWTDLESMDDLELFGAANVPWAQVRVVRDTCGQLASAPRRGEAVDFEELLGAFAQLGRGLRLQFDEPCALTRALGSIALMRFPLERTALYLRADQLTDAWFERVAEVVDGAADDRLELAADGGFLAPLCVVAPDLAAQALERLVAKGVRRLVVPADGEALDALVPLVRASGLEIELATDGGAIGAYVGAVLRGPDAVSTDFDRQQSRSLDPRANRSATVGGLRV